MAGYPQGLQQAIIELAGQIADKNEFLIPYVIVKRDLLDPELPLCGRQPSDFSETQTAARAYITVSQH